MATSRVRHRGHPPRDIDHGPSNGRGRGGTPGVHAQVAAIAQAEASRLVEVGGRMPDGGAGAIERRQATEAQREAWRRDDAPAHLTERSIAKPSIAVKALGSDERLQQSRMRGAARHVQLVAAARSPLIHLADPPVTPPEEIPVSPATLSAVRPPKVIDAELNLPCERCAHEVVCAIRTSIKDQAVQVLSILDDALSIDAPNVVVDCRHFLELAPAISTESSTNIPETIPVAAAKEPARTLPHFHPPAAGGGPGRPAYVARMLEAMVAADGDFTVAATALGIKRVSLVGSMSKLRTRTDLTEAEQAVVKRSRVRRP